MGAGTPVNAGDIAIFGTAINGARSVTLNLNSSVGTLRFNEANNKAFTLNNASGAILTMDSGGGGVALIEVLAANNNGANHTIALPLSLNSALVISNADSSTLTISGTLANNGLTTTYGGSGGITQSGAISGGGDVTMAGSGTLTLSAANTFTGALNINSGTVKLSGSGSLASSVVVSIGSGATFNLNNLSDTIAGLDLTGGTVSTGTGTLTLGGDVTGIADASSAIITGKLNLGGVNRTFTVADGAAATDMSITAVISNGGLTKEGAGLLNLGAANSFTGGVTVNAGTLQLGINSAINSANAVTVNGGTLDFNGRTDTFASLTLSGGAVSGTGTLTMGGNITGTATSGTPTISVGTLNLGGSTRTFDIADGSATSDLSISSIISNGGITKTGAGRLTLSGVNTFTGAINLNAGTISIGADNNLGNAANDITYGGGTLNISTGFTLGSGRVLSVSGGSGTVDVDASQTLTLGTAGQITGGNTLTKTGSGNLTVSLANTGFTGSTVVSGGNVIMGVKDALGTSALTVNTGGEVQLNFGDAVNNSLWSSVTLNGGAIRRTVSGGVQSGIMAASATMTVNGAASLIDAGNDPAANSALIMAGIISIANGGTLTLNAVNANDEVRLSGTAGITIQAGGTLVTTGSGVKSITGARAITGQGTSSSEATITLGGNNSFSGSPTLVVNGTGTGGLRVEGTQANVDTLLTSARMQGVTGSGGTLTVAYSGSGSRTFTSSDTPTTGSSVKLGLDASSGGTPTYILGSTATDELKNWGGLVIKGGSVYLGSYDQNFTGTAGNNTTLDMVGGYFNIQGGGANQVGFESTVTLSGGTIDGGSGGGFPGKLKTQGDIISNGTTLANTPDIIMAPSTGTTTVSGTVALSGIGTFTKQGAGTVTLSATTGGQISANSIDIQSGTLQLAAANRIGDTTQMFLSGGATFATGGYSETVGKLGLTGNGVIDLGSGASVLQFADSSTATWGVGQSLVIANWSGVTNGGGTDQIYIGSSSSGLTASQLGQVYFLDPVGFSPGYYPAYQLASGELVPIPEPATVVGSGVLGLLIAYRERRRIRRGIDSVVRRISG